MNGPPSSRLHIEPPETAAELRAQVAQLQEDARARDRLAALHANRRDELELLLAIRSEELRQLQVELSAAQALERSLKLELHALERQLDPVPDDEPKLQSTGLAGLRVLYVGGRPRSNATIRGLCTRTGIDVSLHDGGIEDRKGLLAAAVPGVDLVLFPVDCVDHDSASRLKRLCQRYGVSYLPLRTAGAASFLAGVTEYLGRPVSVPAQSPSRFCLHHG